MNKCIVAAMTAISMSIISPSFAEEAETAQYAPFDRLFGVKFGTIMSPSKKCETNNVYSLAYEYTPEKKFNEFSDYVIFASPKTRTVYQIRGVYSCSDKDDAKAKIEEVVPILEAKFGREARKFGDGKIIRFPNGDRIIVTIQSNWLFTKIFIDGVSGEFNDLDDEESKQVKADIFKADIAALQILPKPENGGKATRITGLFGRSFGEKLPEDKRLERNDSEALVDYLEVDKAFLGFSAYMVFATPDSREIFMFRAVYTEDDDSEVRDKVVSLLEQLFGVEAEEKDGNKYFIVNGLNGKCLVLITMTDDKIYFDVTDFSLYEKAQEQEKARKRKRFASEFDAL